MGPALAAGNCVVMKPAELTPLSSLAIAELMARGRLSAGRGQYRCPATAASPGQYLAEHPADQQDRLHRFDRDGPQDRAGLGRQSEEACSSNSAARAPTSCSTTPISTRPSTARAFAHLPQPGPGLHRRLAADRCTRASPTNSSRRFIALAASIKLGNPLDPTTEMGPLTSQLHRDRVLSYCRYRARAGRRVLSAARRRTIAALREGLLCDADRRARASPRIASARRKCSARS